MPYQVSGKHRPFMLNNLVALFTKFGDNPQKRHEAKAAYEQPPSLSEKLPWMEYDTETGCFCLDDGKSVAAIFELSDVPAEARTVMYLEQLQRGLQGVFQDVFPLYFDEEAPWIVQFYLQDELSLDGFYERFCDYIEPSAQKTQFTKYYLTLLKTHIASLTKPQGIFVDTKVSGMAFRGKVRKIRAVIYRRLISSSKLHRNQTPAQDLNKIAQVFTAKLEACGVKVKRYQGKEFYEWMVRWFNPAPSKGDSNPDTLLERCPYPDKTDMHWGYDFSERLFFSVPESDEEKGIWYFDGKPHKYLSILGLSTLPQTGHLSLERKWGNYFFGLFDKFPEGSVFTLTVVMQSQEKVKNHIFRIENSTKRATSTEAIMAREDCVVAKRAIESGNYFFPTSMGVYLRGDNIDDLYDKETAVSTSLSSNGFIHLSGDHDLVPITSYLSYLPMCYSFYYDKARMLRSRYLSGKQLSQLLPLYGRERGTGNPAITLFNRSGEPLTLDPFSTSDKDFNSHLLLLGTTGSGKSALCVYLMMQLMAVYRPRLVIIDAGNSFGLLGDYFKTLGLTVNRIEISFKNPVSLNPFAESGKMLAQLHAKEMKESKFSKNSQIINETEKKLKEELDALTEEATPFEYQNQENRDYLGEMLIAAQLMITGGEQKEEDAITRQDRYWILNAIIRAAKQAKANDKDQMIANDIINAFHQMANELETNGKNSDQGTVIRLKKMASNIGLFCQDNLSSQYFNTEGSPWPAADITLLEMGIFKDEGYEAQRALTFMGAMNKTVQLAELHQYEERFTVFFADECHILTNNPLTALSVTKCAKMSRKIGLWLWFATQNVKDFPNDARKMLSMIEFWVCLGMSEAELSEVERFKPVSEEERLLFRSVRKEARKYVEGVILCNRFKSLFRNIPPPLALALAMTEKVEKAERRNLMERYNCTEVEAAIKIAQGIVHNFSRS